MTGSGPTDPPPPAGAGGGWSDPAGDRRRALAIVLALTIVALILRLLPVFDWPLWHDEAETWLASHASAAEFLFWDAHRVHPPLSFAVVRAFTALLGTEAEWALRLPSVLAGTLCVPAAYLVGALGVSRRTGCGFAAFVALYPDFVLQSRSARMYAMLCLVALACFAWLLWLERRGETRPGHWLALGVGLAAAVALHWSGLAVWGGVVAAVLMHARARERGMPGARAPARRPPRGRIRHDPWIRGTALASMLPLAVLLFGIGRVIYWVEWMVLRIIPTAVSSGPGILQQAAVPALPDGWLPWLLAGLAVGIAYAALGIGGLREIHRRRPMLARLLVGTAILSLPFLALGAMFLLTGINRYLIFVVLAGLAGIACAAFEPTSRGATLAGLVLLAVFAAVSASTTPLPRYDVGSVVRQVAAEAGADEAVLYYPCYLGDTGNYYGAPPRPAAGSATASMCSWPLEEVGASRRYREAWLVVGHASPHEPRLRALVAELGDRFGMEDAADRVDGPLSRHGAAAIRFTPGRIRTIAPARTAPAEGVGEERARPAEPTATGRSR